MRSCLQKLRSFRYQMRSALGGDNLDSPEELAQKGVVPNGLGIGMSLGHRHNGSINLPSDSAEGVGINLGELSDAFKLPKEFTSTMERLDGQKVKRIVELMGQCVQVQKSAHDVLKNAIDTQEALKTAIMDKVRQMGLPVSDSEDLAASKGAPSTTSDRGISAFAAAPRTGAKFGRPTVYVRAGAGEWPNANSGKSAKDVERVECSANLQRSANDSSASATYTGIGVLGDPPSQTMQPPQQSRVLKRTDNLFSFISTGTSTASSPSPSFSINARDNSGGGDSTSLDSSTEAASIDPVRTTSVVSVSPPQPNQGTSSMPNPNALDHVDWEAGILLGVQELDETTLRMEMRTSMDIHRLMRSRQKNQLQLHPHQQELSSPSLEMVEGSLKGKGKPSDANLSSTSRSPQGPEFEGDCPFTAWDASVDSITGTGEGSSAAKSTNTSPRSASQDDAPVSTGSVSSDMVAPPLMTSDWKWDEQALDAQLFSFMLDSG